MKALLRIALWLAPGACLALFFLYPANAEPTPQTTAVNVTVVTAPPPSITMSEVPAPAPVPTTVHAVLTRGHERLELDLPEDGKVTADTADAIARMMRCPETGRTRRIAAGTLALLADVVARFPGHEIEIVSAVRGEPDRTRDGIKHSKHWDGHAIDLIVRGAKLSDVRDAMWKNHRDIGVGWYPEGGFIHIDYRPDTHDMAWTQPRRNADNQYNPRWSRLARDVDAESAALRANMKVLFDAGAKLAMVMPSLAEALGYRERETRTVHARHNS